MRDPAPTNTVSEADRDSGISATSTRTPFARTRLACSTATNSSGRTPSSYTARRCGRSSRLRGGESAVRDHKIRARAPRGEERLALEHRRVEQRFVRREERVLVRGEERDDWATRGGRDARD